MRKIRLTENQLNRIVLNTAKRLIRENAIPFAEDYDEDDVNEFARLPNKSDSNTINVLNKIASAEGYNNGLSLWFDYCDKEDEAGVQNSLRNSRNFLDIYGNEPKLYDKEIRKTLMDNDSNMKPYFDSNRAMKKYDELEPFVRYINKNSSNNFDDDIERLIQCMPNDRNEMYLSRGWKERVKQLK